MKKIFFYFQQAGGAQALMPLIRSLQTFCDVRIIGRKSIHQALSRIGITLETFDDLGWDGGQTPVPPPGFSNFHPDLIITDTIDFTRAEDGISGRYIWQWAKMLSIPSIAYVDCWWGYENRFRLPGEDGFQLIPDTIATIDDLARNDLIAAGFNPGKIVTLGSPWFDELNQLGKTLTDTTALRCELGIPSDRFVLLFVSQPLEKTFGSEQLYGFTERTTLCALLNSLNRLDEAVRSTLTLIILLHPEEDDTIPASVVSTFGKGIHTFIRKNDPHKMVLASDLVTGMFSILLAEAVILKRPVISIQLNLKREEILITNRISATLSVNSEVDLSHQITEAIHSAEYRDARLRQQDSFETTPEAIMKWKHYIEKILEET